MINYSAVSLNQLASNIIVELLLQRGCDRFFISPGSRSTPLTSAVAENERTHKIVHFDERGAAFAALGYARATGSAPVLICTSGTAVANYFPAVVEASNDRLPLIVLSADRPPELQGVNANQTIDQIDIYGPYPRSFINLEPPEESREYFTNLIGAINETIAQAKLNPTGPVHINCMFREPLAPLGELKDYSQLLSDLKFTTDAELTSTHEINFDEIRFSENILLVVGYQKDLQHNEAILKFAEKYKLPLFADSRSGLRTDHPNVISYFDQILLSENYNKLDKLSVIHFGGNLVSKRYLEFIERSEIVNYYHCDSEDYTYNPHHKTTQKISAPIDLILNALDEKLSRNNGKLLAHFRKADEKIAQLLTDQIDNNTELSEIKIARVLSQNLTDENCLFLGSSMPVRDYDMFADPVAAKIPLTANRGASGIDGSIATALGFAIGHNKKGVALIGDLAFLHDLNSLALVKKSAQPLLILVINNDGGGIFSSLPVAECENLFEPYFGTPHGYSFKNSAEMFDLEYQMVETSESLKECIKHFNENKQSLVVEIKSNRAENIKRHKELAQLIKEELS